jgi:mannose-6-phosphate isomerase-like protein (cupin superfamily)
MMLVMLSAIALSMGCNAQSRGRVITMDETLSEVVWTATECAQPIAVRKLRVTAESSISLIRLAGAEKPHMHRNHDLIVVVLHGTARLHLGERVLEVQPGDIMEIPRGVVHWSENIGATASEVYAVFSPPYDGLDNIPVLPLIPPSPPPPPPTAPPISP